MKSQSLKLFARFLSDYTLYIIDDLSQVTAEHERTYIGSIEERGKFEVSAEENPVNYPERRGDYGKAVSKTTIANYVRNTKAFFTHLFKSKLRKKPLKN